MSNADENMLEPQSFIGNRITDQSYYDGRDGDGKKINDYAKPGNIPGEKRGPKGFHGMRGKKRDEEVNDDDFDYTFYEKKRPEGFTAVRGK